MNLTIVSKVVEDVAVVGGAVAAALTQSHDPVTVLTIAASAPAVRGLLASIISRGQERSFVGAIKMVRRLIPATAPAAAGTGDTPASVAGPEPAAPAVVESEV